MGEYWEIEGKNHKPEIQFFFRQFFDGSKNQPENFTITFVVHHNDFLPLLETAG